MLDSYQSASYGCLVVLTLASALSPYVIIFPVNISMMLHTLSIIYIGCVLSLKSKQNGTTDAGEVMTSKDAAMFPLIGSCSLLGLYALFKLFDKEWVNFLLSIYFSVVGTYSLTEAFDPLVEAAFFVTRQATFVKKTLKFPFMDALDIEITRSQAVTFCFATVFASAWFMTKHFILNNLFGIAFSIKGIEALALGSYKTGAILLTGLFFYDIFWVFGTDVMVTVATSFDAPIKLLFPRTLATETVKAQFSLLGLGDIVIPGIFIAMLLRFDAHRAGKAGESGLNFPKPFFTTQMIAYFLGLLATVLVMQVFNAAQPALLYLVPACLGGSLLTALVQKDLKGLWAFTEEEEETKEDDKTSEDNTKTKASKKNE